MKRTFVKKVLFVQCRDANELFFEIEIGNPNQEIRTRTIVAGKSKKQLDETTMQLPVGSGLFFQSSYFHRVLPVKTGLRKSLVGWVLGPKFK